jgi:UDP-N-acetylmuramoylalanine--D-glutamate ligase
MKRALQGKKALVVGLGKSGLAAARLLAREGAVLSAADEKPAVECADELRKLNAALHLGSLDPKLFSAQDLVVTSPGVPLTHAAFGAAREKGVPVIGEVELASGFIDEPVLAITGTNGKSTTTALCGHICAASGLASFTGGNLGKPLSERALGNRGDVAVVELSSFQLESIDSFRPRGAAFLNLTPDHLDRYASHESYGQAKARIFMNQAEGDFAVVNAHDAAAMRLSENINSVRYTFGHGSTVTRGIRNLGGKLNLRLADDLADESYALGNRALRGLHNRENAMAAVLLTRLFGVEKEKVQAGLDSYPGLPHRLEWVRELDGVEWINDSKATNVDSTLVALRSFENGLVLIAGGRGKGAPYEPLVALAKGKIRAVLTIGEDAPAVQRAFEGVVPVVGCRELQVAVERARTLARRGDTVLLSPACSSYDQFKNFEERGDRFKMLVAGL